MSGIGLIGNSMEFQTDFPTKVGSKLAQTLIHRKNGQTTKLIKLELYTNSVFLVGIQLVFLGIYQTDTRGKRGWYISVLYFWREPLFFK
jgi:hypothetical protein